MVPGLRASGLALCVDLVDISDIYVWQVYQGGNARRDIVYFHDKKLKIEENVLKRGKENYYEE